MFDINIDPSSLKMDQLSSVLDNFPPSRENWQTVLRFWQWSYPVVRS